MEWQMHSPEPLTELNPQGTGSANSCGRNSNLFALAGNANQFNRSRGGAGDPRFDASHERNAGIRRFASRSYSRRRQSLGLDQTDDRTYLEFDETFLPQVSSVSLPTKFLDIVFSDRHGFHPNPPVYW
jgi:hypothetical protein